ncbi:MAG: carbonic anhydrase [Chloroflexota bacterium]|nr:MAG: carbonic anhydrase [Chloroflexota bacterium]
MSPVRNTSRWECLSISEPAVAQSALAACAQTAAWQAALAAEPPVANADEALQRLIEGNQRYVANKAIRPNQTESRRVEVAKGQYPFASILGCADSRVPSEIIFDRGLGDLFIIRTAGQVLDDAVMGSIEFGAKVLGIPLILVLGHERCGAVDATIGALQKHAEVEGSIGALVEGIKPAVEKAKEQPGDLLDNAVRANVELGVVNLKKSPVLAKLLRENKLKIVGGHYDLDTGAVDFMVF